MFLPGASPGQLDQAWSLAEDAAREVGIRLARANAWEDDALTLGVLGLNEELGYREIAGLLTLHRRLDG